MLASLVAACADGTSDPADNAADPATVSESDEGPVEGDGSADGEQTTDGDAQAEADVAQQDDEAPQGPVGTISIAGSSYELVASHWCDTEEAIDADEIAVRVFARDTDAGVTVHAYELTYDDPDRSAVQRVSVLETVGEEMNVYESGDLRESGDGFPFLEVDGNQVAIEAELSHGGDMHDVIAEFVIPDEPGMPQYC